MVWAGIHTHIGSPIAMARFHIVVDLQPNTRRIWDRVAVITRIMNITVRHIWDYKGCQVQVQVFERIHAIRRTHQPIIISIIGKFRRRMRRRRKTRTMLRTLTVARIRRKRCRNPNGGPPRRFADINSYRNMTATRIDISVIRRALRCRRCVCMRPNNRPPPRPRIIIFTTPPWIGASSHRFPA